MHLYTVKERETFIISVYVDELLLTSKIRDKMEELS